MNDPAPYRIASDKLGFYIAASDQEILAQVNRLMTRSGYVGIMDTAGRLQYLVDGRRGSPYAARRIVETTGRIMRDRKNQANPLLPVSGPAADEVLAAYGILPELEGLPLSALSAAAGRPRRGTAPAGQQDPVSGGCQPFPGQRQPRSNGTSVMRCRRSRPAPASA